MNSAGAPPFVGFKRWGFKFNDIRQCGEGWLEIPSLAKTAKTGLQPALSIMFNMVQTQMC